jgi:dipeptidyl aminopeptidase/acylaminoacyl peptidase
MMRISSVRILFIVTLLTLTAGLAQAEGITVEQLLDIEQVRSCDLAPDGQSALYTVSRNRDMDEEAGSSWTELWVVGTGGGEPTPFVTGQVSVGSPKFSPDGRYIGFTTKRGGEKAKTQVWVIPVDGGEAQVATASKTGVGSWAWNHDGTVIYYIDTEEAPEKEKDLKKKGWLPKVYEENLRSKPHRKVAFYPGREPAEAATVVDGMAVWGMTTEPTGRWLVFSASPENLIDSKYMFTDLYRLNLADGSYEKLVDVPGKMGAFKISPDGQLLAWTGAATREDHSVSSLFVVPMDGTGASVNMTPESFEGHIRSMVWRDKKTVLYMADEGLYPTLSTLEVTKAGAERKMIYDSKANGIITGLPAARPGLKTMVLVGHDPVTPRELYAWQGQREAKRLTFHNEWLDEVELGEQRAIEWTAEDGLVIEGVLMMPVDYTVGRFPLIVQVHGGPESNHTNGWLSRYANPGQAFCARGYGVLFSNYRGSTGRGIEFAASAYGDPAGLEFEDIVDGVDYLVHRGVVDKKRVGVTGGSYGGYATYWLTTFHTEKFAAGVGMVGVSDLVSKRFLTDIPYEDQYVHMGVPVRESWDLMLERSPIRYADKSRTPLLILHGENDTRVHPSQSQELYRAMKMAGHPSVRLIWYPGEGHGNRKRWGRADFVHRSIAWFDHYLMDKAPWDGPMPPVDISDTMGLPLEEPLED